jgi:periplasmic divalent cation tolerance protein
MDDLEEFEAAPDAQSAPEPRQHKDMSAILIYTTFPSQSEAKKLGRALVESGLAACVNIFPQMLAIFSWEGKIEEADEAAMIVKTVRAREAEVLAEIKRLHPYAAPARLVLPVSGGGEDFLRWVAERSGPQK